MLLNKFKKIGAMRRDIFSIAERSRIMSLIRVKNTAPERLVKSALRVLGQRYRSHTKAMPGCPDIVLPEIKTVIFVNGCFWHQHGHCKRPGIPIKNPGSFWRKKFEKNAARLKHQSRLLRSKGWAVFTIWECKLGKNNGKTEAAIVEVNKILNRVKLRNEKKKKQRKAN